MTVINLTEFNAGCYGVTFQNNGFLTVQNFEGIPNHENNIYCVKPLEIILGKSELFIMTIKSRASKKAVFDGNTILPKVTVENNKHKYVYIGDVICSFLTNDIII